jgi:diguanylate cyclase (GGDEF)-like protein
VVRAGSVLLFLLGLVLLGLIWSVLRAYRRRVEEAQATERRQLERAAVTDSVTGLGNHRAFHETLQREVSRSLRHQQVLSLALVDIDDFKGINDQHGHSHGDRVLSRLATFFADLRLEDQPFRLGGDEFAVILPSADASTAITCMERLCGRTEQSLFGTTVSVGIAQLTPVRDISNMDAETLREMADAALYEAKRRGRNAVVTFEEIKASASIVTTRHINAVRRLLAERDFAIAFQPIWDVQRRVLLGYEALMRPAEQYGLSGPQDAFDIAEKLGRASELDEMCRDRILASAPKLPPGVCLFINVSPASLDHTRFGDEALRHALEMAGLKPSSIVFEITERAVARAEMVVRETRRLRAAGFRLALDDVGAGNAGLEVLRPVPVDFVKIDRSVVAEALVDGSAAVVLAGIMAFARKANTFVIAEGIETPAMLDMIHRLMRPSAAGERAIQGAQGYLLGKPQPQPLEPDKPRVQTQIDRTDAPETRAG